MIKKIAIRMPNWIGDAVLSTPFLKYTRTIFKNDQLYLVLRSSVKDVFINNPHYNEMIIIDDKKSGLIKAGLSLRQYRFDYFFNLPESFSSGLICYLSGAKNRIGWQKELGHIWFTQKYNPKQFSHIHRSLKYLKLLHSFKKVIREIKTGIYLSKGELKQAQQILHSLKLKKRILGINANCSAPSRRWLKERFAQLADILLENKQTSIIFFGNKKEFNYNNSLIHLMEHKPINLAGKINLREYIGILKLIDLFITNDSGPMHLANALGTPVIALEGPADIQETGMVNKSRLIYINKNIFCSPCVKNICPYGMECMKAIQVEDVLKAIKKILS